MAYVFFSLGSNKGDRTAALQGAIDALGGAVTLSQASRVHETLPLHVTDQPLFLNQVVAGMTELSPIDLLIFIKSLEQLLGRTPSIRFGPREIDIDILYYDDVVMNTPDLIIPHPRMCERLFVLEPLSEIALRCPVTGQLFADMIQKIV